MKPISNYTIFENPETLYSFVANALKNFSLMPRIQHICLSGGSTPRGLFTYILSNHYAHSIQWNNLHFWWGDERCVLPESSQSNYGEAKRLFFNTIDINEENIHPIKFIDNNYEAALKTISSEMNASLKLKNNYPVFDWILLGVGEDGHTASLFPNGVDLDASETVLLARKPGTQEQRITLSANTIRASKRISYLVVGRSKAKVMHEIITNDNASKTYPARLISSDSGKTEYLLDQQAGSFIQARGNCQ